MMYKKKIAVTGSTGYIGRRLIRAAFIKGYQVVSLSRRPTPTPSLWIKYDLGSREPVSLPSDIDVIVHLAANTSFHDQLSDLEEIHAAINILNAAKTGGIKFIFISSQTARVDAPTSYGRIKFQIERLVIDADGIVIRPGLVYGGPYSGLYGELVKLVSRFPLIPLFFPAPRVQPIHVDDLVIGILKVAECPLDKIGSVIKLGSVDPISFNHFLGIIATHRLRNIRIFIPIPSVFIHLMGKVFARIGGGLNRLNSLFELPAMHTRDDLQLLNLHLRPIVSGMNCSGSISRRHLLLEGLAFYVYLSSFNIKKSNIRNYVRVIEMLRNSMALGLPFRHQIWPFLIAILDGRNIEQCPWTEEFRWRLKAATLLAESSTSGAINFIDPDGGGFIHNFIGVLGAFLFEIFIKIFRFFLRPFFKLIFSGKINL